jgi:hypothetical protein
VPDHRPANCIAQHKTKLITLSNTVGSASWVESIDSHLPSLSLPQSKLASQIAHISTEQFVADLGAFLAQNPA